MRMSIDNNMISSAIWCKQTQVKCLFTPIIREIILFPINNLHEKSITESQDRPNFDSASAICNLHSFYFSPVLQFLARVSIDNNMISSAIWCK